MVSSFRKLVVYQRALDVLVSVNRLCLGLARDFMFVAWQARRAASSVVLNTTEGAGKTGRSRRRGCTASPDGQAGRHRQRLRLVFGSKYLNRLKSGLSIQSWMRSVQCCGR